jgi:hypothetical protein
VTYPGDSTRVDPAVSGRVYGGPDKVADLWWLVAGRLSSAGVTLADLSSLSSIRRDDERFTSLLGRSRSFMDGRDGAEEPSSRDEEEEGLSPRCRDKVEILLSHV